MACGNCNSSVSLTSVLAQMAEILDQLIILNNGLGIGDLTNTPATPITMVVLDAGIIGAASDYSNGMMDAHAKRYVLIQNRSDGAILISLDGSHAHFPLTAGSTLQIPFGQTGRTHSSNIGVKGDPSGPPTDGDIVISAYY